MDHVLDFTKTIGRAWPCHSTDEHLVAANDQQARTFTAIESAATAAAAREARNPSVDIIRWGGMGELQRRIERDRPRH